MVYVALNTLTMLFCVLPHYVSFFAMNTYCASTVLKVFCSVLGEQNLTWSLTL